VSEKMVHKHQLEPGVTKLDLVRGAEILLAAEQHGNAFLWEAHSTEETSRETRWFHVVGTGIPFNRMFPVVAHVGSFLIPGGDFVFHVFEVTEPPDPTPEGIANEREEDPHV
jgi:hypothetical protein